MAKLTEKQKRFCHEYLKDSNATQAAIRAGYSERTAKEGGYENLTKPHVADYLKSLQKELNAETIFSVNDRIKMLAEIATVCAASKGDDETGELKLVNPTAAISAIDQINKMTGDHAAIKQKLDADVELAAVPTSINLIAKK